MNYEIIGTLASVIVLISFLMKGERNIRLINILGSILFIVYGVLIKAFSVLILNIILFVVHAIKISKK